MGSIRNAAFTLVELLVATTISAGVGIGLVSFTLASTTLAARNLAYNHGHSTLLTANIRLLKELQNSGSIFTLMDFNGTTYTGATVTVTTDQDPLTGGYLSSRSNAVRFWRNVAGPKQLTASTTPTTTNLTFDFGPLDDGQLPYIPAVNDKLWFPLIRSEFKITAVVTAPTTSNTTGVVTIHQTGGVGYTLSTTSPNITTAFFFRQAAFTVYGNQLRYDPAFNGSTSTSPWVTCSNVTSPKPFSVLYRTNTSGTSERVDLRLSLEAYDLDYSNLKFPNGAGTLQTVISLRDQPPLISCLQTPQ